MTRIGTIEHPHRVRREALLAARCASLTAWTVGATSNFFVLSDYLGLNRTSLRYP